MQDVMWHLLSLLVIFTEIVYLEGNSDPSFCSLENLLPAVYRAMYVLARITVSGYLLRAL